jgi:hydroxymethylglutaryl-CoA reductase
LGVALNALVNGEDRLIPMVVEEPSVIAAASNACKMLRAGGGFVARTDEALMISQIELRNVAAPEEAESLILESKGALLALAGEAVPGLVRRGGGPRDIEVRHIGPGHMVVHLLVDVCDAMGANLVNSAAEALGVPLAELTHADLGLRILSNLSDRRLAKVHATAPFSALVSNGNEAEGRKVAQAIEDASIFAERDGYRAATHNKGIMNGVDSVVLATGNDYRAVEAGAHAFAAASGRYLPLSTWRVRKDGVEGSMTIPLALGIVGGTLRVHDGARLSLALCEAKSASDLAELAACAGLASNLAALRALATEGIQRGHMLLHARSVAIFAGAIAEEVDRVAQLIAEAGTVTAEAAKKALMSLRTTQLEPKQDS